MSFGVIEKPRVFCISVPLPEGRCRFEMGGKDAGASESRSTNEELQLP